MVLAEGPDGDLGLSFSIRNLFTRGMVRVPRSVGGSRRARKLVARGIAAENSGNTIEALQYFRRAVEANPSFAPAHMNVGIALQAAGELGAAVASYEQAIAVDSEYAAAYHNLALALLMLKRYSEAEASFLAALRIRGNFPEAWVGLANTLEALGRDNDALSALDKAIALRGDYVGALLNSSALLRKLGRLEAVVASCRRILALEPDNHLVQFRLGISLQDLGHMSEAESLYRRVLSKKPDHVEAKTNLALVQKSNGNIEEAIRLLFEVVANEPADIRLRNFLVDALNGVAFTRVGEMERSVLLSLCTDDQISMLYLNTAIVGLMKSHEGFNTLREAARRGEDPFASMTPAVAAFLRDSLLLAALPRMTIADTAVEEVLAHVRRCIVVRSGRARGLVPADSAVPVEFMCAMARQCFFSGYAWCATEAELEQVASVCRSLEVALHESRATPTTLESTLVLVSLYQSLHILRGSELLPKYPKAEWSEAFQPIVREQIENRNREREIAQQLASITTIDDDVSLAVRAQYEDNPYPRWITVSCPEIGTIESLSRRLQPGQSIRIRPRPVPVLIAGCGTGHHPIQVARAYPDSEILAVDLSRASLGYAVRMTEHLGISNITYRQADILRLGNLDQRFAMVECSGVLHHIDNPMAGWRVLISLLESDGLMKIALYSEKARSAVRAAREFIQVLNIPPTAEGIRQCRHAIINLPDGHPVKDVMKFRDFYTLDGCRDLMMHAREHQFTLPRIAECLGLLKLQLLALESTPTTRSRFVAMFPDRNADTDLDAWDQFEDAFPETFMSMYSFWCCRK